MQQYKLSNGIQVVCEKIPHFRSFSIGFWVGAGSCSESIEINGISHFIEHMLFKGTASRTPKQIAGEIDSLGGQLNAFTAKECTCFYVALLDEHADKAIDLLCDILQNSKLATEDIEREKGVVLEEISMVEDTPDELAHELLSKAYYGDHPLGKTILGTKETVSAITREKILQYMAEYYISTNIVISIAGSFDEDFVMQMLEEKIGKIMPKSDKMITRCNVPFENKRSVQLLSKDIEQVNLCLGFKAAAQTSDQLYAQLMVNNFFGGGMSSRLFQRVREQNGMTYAIYSYPSLSTNSGVMTIYAGMNPGQAMSVYKLIVDEIKIIKQTGISEEEFKDAKEQLKGSFILGMESASSIMNRNDKSQLLQNEIKSQDQVIDLINKVTIEEVNENIKAIFNTDVMCASMVGKIKTDDELYKILEERIDDAGQA